MVSKSILGLCAFLVGIAGAADAATLYTPAIANGAAYHCAAVNVAKRPRDVTLSLFANNSGSILNISCPALQPGHVCLLLTSNPVLACYCRIDVTGSKSSIRGSLTALNGGVTAGVVAAQ